MGMSEKITNRIGIVEERAGALAGSERLVKVGRRQQAEAAERDEQKNAARSLRKKAKKAEKKAHRLEKKAGSAPGKKVQKKVAKLQKKARKLAKQARKA